MRPIRFVPDKTNIDFVAVRQLGFAFSLVLVLITVVSLALRGLNLGIDFEGGIMVQAQSAAAFDLAELRSRLAGLELGEVALQQFGNANELMIRVHQQEGGAAAQAQAIEAIKTALGPAFEIRQTEYIGPQVSREFLIKGYMAAGLAVLLISLYVWFRFDWQFGAAAMIATLHDVVTTFGLFSLFQIQFDLTAVAAILTIAGYSINDTVVVFDRIRENLRRYKKMELGELINRSINQTLSRTLLTSGTTMLAVVALLGFGGPVLFSFSAALAWGIAIGTYSSLYVAAALLLYMPPLRAREPLPEGADRSPPPAAPAAPAAGRR